MPREGEFDYRWLRVGWFDQERPCDAAVQFAVAQIPGGTMPPRWHAADPISFVEKYGAGVRWSRTMSYHMLLISGWPILRIWTNAKTKTLIEVADRFVPLLRKDGFTVEAIPEGTKKRRKEFNWRFQMEIPAELDYLLSLVKVLYGVGEE